MARTKRRLHFATFIYVAGSRAATFRHAGLFFNITKKKQLKSKFLRINCFLREDGSLVVEIYVLVRAAEPNFMEIYVN